MPPIPSLHDLLATAGPIHGMKPKALRVLCIALIGFATEADRRVATAEGREQATYLALVREKQRRTEIAAHTKRPRGPAVKALIRRLRK